MARWAWVVIILVVVSVCVVGVALVVGSGRTRWLFSAPLDRGRLLWKVGRYDEAMKNFRRALEASPHEVVALRGMARCYMGKGNLKEAAGWADRALAVDTTPVAQVLRAEIAASQGGIWRELPEGVTKPDESDRGHLGTAMDHARAALKMDKAYGPAHRVLAQVTVRLGDRKAALAHVERALDVDADSQQTRLLAAHLLMGENRFDDAMEHVQYVLDKLNAKSRAALRLGTELCLVMGKFDEALDFGNRLVAAGERGGGAHTLLAAAYLGKGDYVKAVAKGDKAEQLFGGKIADLRLYWARGTALLKLRQFDRAVVDFTVVAEQGESDPVAYCRLGQAYVGCGQDDLARDAFFKASRLDPRFFPAREELAKLLTRKGRTAEALAQLRKGVEALGDNAHAYESLLRFCREHGLEGQAEDELRRLLSLHPKSSRLVAMLAKLHVDRSDTEHALPLARYALALAPNSAKLIHLVGQVEAAHGSYNAAAARFARVVKVAPTYTAPYFDWARMEHERGRTAAADDIYERAAKALRNPVEVQIAQARFWMETGRGERAVAALRKIIANDPSRLAARVPLVEHLLARGLKDEALAEAKKAVRNLPSSVAGQSLLARVHRARGEWSQFHVVIGNVVQSLDPDAWVGYQRVAACVHEERYVGAVDAAREAMARFPARQRTIRLDMAIAQFLAARRQEAIDAVQLIVSGNGFDRDAGVILSLMRLLASGKAPPIPACREDALPPVALDAWRELVQLHVRQREAVRAVARLLLEAFVYEHAGWHDITVAVCGKASAALPGCKLPSVLAAATLERAGNRAEAVDVCTRLVKQHPQSARAHELLGDLTLLTGKAQAADRFYAEGTRLEAASADAAAMALRVKRALLAAARGDHREAIRVWRTVLHDEPRHLQACNNLAWLLATSQKPDMPEAVRLAELARTVAPAKPAVLDTAGCVYYKAGNYGKAIKLLRTATRAAPYRAAYHFHLGMAYVRQGETRTARQALRKAIELDREGEFVDAARQALANLGA